MSLSKTYKREVGALCLVFCFYLALADKVQALEILVLPSFTFAAMAFGMDWGSKQTSLTGTKPKSTEE